MQILTQGWVSKFSSLNTNFFQACTDNAWQTPVGLKLPPDGGTLTSPGAKKTGFIFSSVHITGTQSYRCGPQGKILTSNDISALSFLWTCAEEVSRPSEHCSHKYRKHLKFFPRFRKDDNGHSCAYLCTNHRVSQ